MRSRCLHGPVGLILGTVLGLSIIGPAGAQDEVRHSDRALKRENLVTAGTILTESPAGVVVKPQAGTVNRDIPAAEIADIIYEVPGALRLDYRRAQAEERKLATLASADDRRRALRELIKAYRDLVPALGGERYRFARRHLQFKVAFLLARLAEEEPPAAGAALEALAAFQREHGDGWQISMAAKLLARLQTGKGDLEGALKTYRELAALPGLPGETRQESELLAARALLQGKKYAEAEEKLQVLLKGYAADTPPALRAQVYLAVCTAGKGQLAEAVRRLEGILAATADPIVKATAANALGDCYRLHGRAKDALWAYLWVDVIYHQDRQELTYALGQLAQLFAELGDTNRSRSYQERLQKSGR